MPSSTSWLALVLASSVHHALADLPMLTAADAAAYNAGQYGTLPNQTFYSSDLIAPRFLVTKWEDKTAKKWENRTVNTGSHIFLSPQIPGQTQGPMILSADDLSLVYADPSWSGGPNTMVQMYKGDPYLTFWSGMFLRGGGNGGGVLVDSSYQEVTNITTSNFPTLADSHEFELTPDGGALFINFHTATADCTAVGGGRNCTLRTSAFQEVDVATGEPRFTWRAEDHFALDESLAPWSGNDSSQWDWFHLNSLEKTTSGDYLISARYLSMVALINGTSGDKIWQVGGKNSDFRDADASVNSSSSAAGPGATFAFQHDARFAGGARSGGPDNAFDDITLFDNHIKDSSQPTPGCAADCSRGLRIRLDHAAGTFSLVHQLYHPAGVQTWAEGGYQTLPGGGAIVVWGTVPAFAEFTPAGETVFEAQIAPWSAAATGEASLYRMYKFDWTATPLTKPDVAVVDGAVYVSWNGATEVARWALYGGQDGDSLIKLATVPRAGFETAIVLDSLPSMVKVEALDARGHTIGSTDLVES